MQQLLEKIFDVLFPPSESILLVRACDTQTIPHLLHRQTVGKITALADFKNPTVRALIIEAKFHNNQKALSLLGTILDAYLNTLSLTEEHIIIPIPLSKTRLRSRGYNQVSEVIKKVFPEKNKSYLNEKIMFRERETKPQTELARSERHQNVADAFGVRNPKLITGKHIILIDDVITTGATLSVAKAALLPHHPASITCVTLAH